MLEYLRKQLRSSMATDTATWLADIHAPVNRCKYANKSNDNQTRTSKCCVAFYFIFIKI